MNEDRDPVLQALFVDAQQDLKSEEFVAGVMTRVQQLKQRVIAGATGATVLALVIALLLSVPVFDLAFVATDALAIEIISIGNSTAAWLLAPINNIATMIVVLFKGLRMGMKKARNASYVN